MKPSSLKSLLTNASHIGAARFFNVISRTVYVLVIARVLGPELYGLFAYSQAWYMAFMPATALGGLFLFSRDKKPDQAHVEEILPLTLALRLSLSIIVSVSCATVGLMIEDNPEVRILFGMFTVALMARAISGVANQLFNFYEVSHLMLSQGMLFRSIELALGITVLLAGGGIIELGLVHTVSWCLQAARAVIVANRIKAIRLRFAWLEMFKILATRGMVAGVGTALMTWMVQGPLIMARHSADLEPSLGQLALSIQAFAIASIAPLAVSTAVYPMLVRSIAREDGKDMTYVSGMWRATVLFGSTAGLTGLAMGPWLADFLLGNQFALTGELVGISLWLIIPHVIASSAGPLLSVRGRYAAQLWRALLGVTVMAISFPYLTGWLGPAGAIASAGLGLTTSAITQISFLTRIGTINLKRAILKPLLAGMLGLLAYHALADIAGEPIRLAASLTLLAVATLVLGIFTPGERAAFLERLRHLRSGTE